MLPTHRPSHRQSKPVVNLQLTFTQRSLIRDRYKSAYTDQGVWPDIKLEAFMEFVMAERPASTVPVYFAQRMEVLKFAELNGLPWLVDMIRSETLRTMSPEVETQP